MQVQVTTLDQGDAGTIELNDAVFGVPVHADILQRVVVWQLAKRRQGTHKAKTRGEVHGSGRKMYKQKGTGRARHSTRKVNLWRGGGVAFPPVPRDHAIDLPKKVRRLGLKMALSSKAADGKLIVLDEARLDAPKTKGLAQRLARLGLDASTLVIDGPEPDRNFTLAARNLPTVQVMPGEGANVYDILRRDKLVLTRRAVEHLQERLA
jgi:large subunit ribosomal protein L4